MARRCICLRHPFPTSKVQHPAPIPVPPQIMLSNPHSSLFELAVQSLLYKVSPMSPRAWREGKNLPKAQGLLVGSSWHRNKVTAYIDESDVHMLMIGAADFSAFAL